MVIQIRPHKRVKDAVVKRIDLFRTPVEHWWAKGWTGRDTQKGKCYAAERDVAKLPDFQCRIFSELEDMSLYVRDVMESEWFQIRWPRFYQLNLRIIGKRTYCRGGPRAWDEGDKWATTGMVRMAYWGMGFCDDEKAQGGEMILLHELAHAICPNEEKHGRLWARTYLELVKQQMPAVAPALEESFIRHRVRFRPYNIWQSSANCLKK